jgi:hypothetical protein
LEGGIEMTVQEVIDTLMKVEDKTKRVMVLGKWSNEFEEVETIEESVSLDRVYLED